MCNENGFVLDTKEDGYDAVSLKFNGNLFADVCHGDGLLTVEGVDMLNIKVENTKSDGSEAKLTFTPAEGLTEELKYMQETSDISQILGVDLTKCSIVLKIMSEFDENSIRGNMKYGIALTTAEGPVASITANMEYSEPDGVELPADFKIVNDEDGIIEWINTADIFGFIASLPEGVSSLITGLMMSNVMG